MTRPIPIGAGILALSLAGATCVALAVVEPGPDPVVLGLYEWMGPAPVVVAGDVVADDGKLVQAVIVKSVKGGVPPGGTVQVDLRGANRDREEGVAALKLPRGGSFLLLLKPGTRKSSEAGPVYALVRGTRGAKPIPAEGREALVEAAVRLGELQERRSDDLLWKTLPTLLEDPNPLLVDASLELYVKFRRETPAMVPVLEPLLESARPAVRENAVVVLGRILARAAPGDVPERSVAIGELTGRARRDEAPSVRRAATIALAPLADPGVDETLRTIAKDDPDQDVRFDAEKAVYERSLARPAPARGD